MPPSVPGSPPVSLAASAISVPLYVQMLFPIELDTQAAFDRSACKWDALVDTLTDTGCSAPFSVCAARSGMCVGTYLCAIAARGCIITSSRGYIRKSIDQPLTDGRTDACRLMSLQFESLAKEADMRFALVRVRENCESIAFYEGHAAESACVSQRFKSVVTNRMQVINWSALLALWKNLYTYSTILVPSSVTAPLYFAGKVQFGVVTQVCHFAHFVAMSTISLCDVKRVQFAVHEPSVLGVLG